jgi:hypothetical protein
MRYADMSLERLFLSLYVLHSLSLCGSTYLYKLHDVDVSLPYLTLPIGLATNF